MKRSDLDKLLMLTILVMFSSLTISCTGGFLGGDDDPYVAPLTNAQIYANAVKDSMTRNQIFNGLTVISATNENLVWNGDHTMIAVLTIMRPGREGSYAPAGKQITVAWKMFVTAAPDLKNKIAAARPFTNLTLRVEQMLGLPDNGYKYCVELWAKPADLFRPSPDSEADDSVAGLVYPSTATTDHKNWLNQHIYESYFSDSLFPFTRLGYTYDWLGANNNVIGASEFVVKVGSTLAVKAEPVALEQYFQ